MPFEQQSDRERLQHRPERIHRRESIARDKTMETKNKVKVKVIKNKAKVNVNKSTVVEHPYCLRDRSVDDLTYPAHTLSCHAQ